MTQLLQEYTLFSAQHPDTTMPPMQFAENLYARRDAWFVEVGSDGIAFFTNIIPSFMADFHVAFWDRKFGKDRVELIRSVLLTAMTRFDLKRCTAIVPATNQILTEKLVKVGFVYEGTMQLGWHGRDHAVILGLLPEYLTPWPVPQMLTSSLD